MNKHLYRIVFNRALGVPQVVSELVSRSGGTGAKEPGRNTTRVRPVSFSLWLALGWVGLTSVASAQISGDPNAPGNQRPTVLGVADHAPVIQIQTPSAAGVSRNTYNRFNVGAEGAVLNNSRTNVQSQLAGSIAGNTWLATGTAKVILNEVTGANPSQLNGYVEVAGDRAQVIIANPAGIACDGCGFINANRVTLTTGIPVLSGGALDGYRVTGGSIRVDGKGLDATHADYTDLIARAMQVNAGIWTPQLQVSLGANEVSADHQKVGASSVGGPGGAPAFALDVSALGGMYANKITLLGTEHGVGARNAGNIGAQAGELAVTMDGRLENAGTLQSLADTRVTATGGLANTGTVSATRELQVRSGADLDNSGGVLNAARIDVEAASLRNQGGDIAQSGLQGMTLQAGGLSNRVGSIGAPMSEGGGSPGDTAPPEGSTPPVTGGEGGQAGTTPPDGGAPAITLPPVLAEGALRIAGLLDNDGGRISAAAGFDLSSASGLANDGGRLGLRQLTLNGGDLGNRGGELLIDGAASIQAQRIDNDAGLLAINGPLSLEARNLSNRGGTFQQLDTRITTFTITDTLDNSDGTVVSNASSLAMAAGTLVNERGNIVHTGMDGLRVQTSALYGAGGKLASGSAMLLAAGAVDHRRATLSATRLTLVADAFDNRSGLVSTSGNDADALMVSGALDNSDGVIAGNGDMVLGAAWLGNADGIIQHAGNGRLAIHADTLDGAGGTIASNGALALAGNSLNLRNGTTYAQDITVNAGSLTTANGTLAALGSGPLTLNVRGALDNAGGSIATNGALILHAQSLVNAAGTLSAAGSDATAVTVNGVFDNARGTLSAMGNTGVHAGTLVNQGGTIQAANGSSLTVAADGLLDNSARGVMASDGDLRVSAVTLDNTQGAIRHAGEGDATITAGTLHGAGGSIASNGSLAMQGGIINLRDGITSAQLIALSADALTTAGGNFTALGGAPLRLTVGGLLDNSGGTIATNGALLLQAQSLVNFDGTLFASGNEATNLRVGGTFDNTRGTLAAMGSTTVQAGSLVNRGGAVHAADGASLAVTATDLLDNSEHGVMASDGDLAIAAATLDNTHGTIQHAGDGALTIHAATLNGAGGNIVSNGALTLVGEITNLSQASTSAQQIRIDTGTLITAGGSLSALGDGLFYLSARNALDNTGGQIATNGYLQLSTSWLTNRDGAILAAGLGNTVLAVSNAFDNTRGTLGTAGPTTLYAGSLNNTAGTVQASSAAPLTVFITSHGAVDGAFVNDDGALVSNGDLALAADSVSNRGGSIQAQQSIDATVGGAFDNSGGLLVAAGDLAIQAVSLLNRDTAQGGAALSLQGVYGNRVTLRADAIDNTRGQLHANDSLSLGGRAAGSSGHVINAAGIMEGTGDVAVHATTLDNAGGQLIQRGSNGTLTVNAHQALTNTVGGVIGAEGDATLTAGSFDNSGGTLDVTGAATIQAASIANVNGRMLAGSSANAEAALRVISSGGLDNRGGMLGNRGGDLIVQASAVDNRAGGTLVAQRDLNLDNVGGLNNAAGTTYATRNLSYQNGGAALDNSAGGQLGAGDNAWLNLATLTNTDGGHIQASTLWLTTPTLNLGGGEVDAAVLHATFANLSGIGRLYATQWLDIRATGDYTHLAGQRFESDDLLNLAVDGTLTNLGSLQTAGELNVTAAADIVNQGTINASAADGSASAHLHAGGRIDNQAGASIAGDTLSLIASDITNSSHLGIAGDVVRIEANTLTNGRDLAQHMASVDYGEGFIGASQRLDLHVGRLANLDGTIYSGGDLLLAGRGSGSRASSLDNASGLIQAGGNITLDVDSINNHRRVFATETVNLTLAEQAKNSTTITEARYAYDDTNPAHQVPNVDPWQIVDSAEYAIAKRYCDVLNGTTDDQRCQGYPFGVGKPETFQGVITNTVTSVTRMVTGATSAASRIVSGGDITLHSNAVINDKSAIAAGRNFSINDENGGLSGVLQNISWAPTATIRSVLDRQVDTQLLVQNPRHWIEGGWQSYGTQASTQTLLLTDGAKPDWITYDAGPSAPASLTAGGQLLVVVRDVVNTTTGSGSIGVQGPGATSLSDGLGARAVRADDIDRAQGNSVGRSGGVGPAQGDAVGAADRAGGASAQVVGSADHPLPGYVPPSNGMVSQQADPNAPFLLSTAPRFARGPVTSSDYLLQALRQDPSNVHKRLGDGYVEQSLVLDQILQLTGRRSLNGGDPMAQYQTLMEGASNEAARLGLQLGAPLTTEQIGALDSDIVWLVDQVVNGERVLVPVVYLSKATAERLHNGGALMAGDTVAVQAAGSVRNDGSISSTQGTWLSADTLINTGALKSDGVLGIATRNDTINAGTLQGGAVSVSAGRDVISTGAITSRSDLAVLAGRDLALGAAPVQATGNLALVAGRDLTTTATRIQAGGDAQLVAGRDLTLNATGHTSRTGEAGNGQETFTHSVSTVSAGGNLAISAGNNLTSQGAQFSAGNQLGLAAGNDLTLNAVTDYQTTSSLGTQGRTIVRTSTHDETVQGSTLSGANGVSLVAGHDLTATSASITSANGNVGLAAGHDLTLNTAQENHFATVDTKTSSGNAITGKTTTRTHDSVGDTYAIGTAIQGNNVQLVAGHDLTANAAQVVADQGVRLSAGHDLILGTGQNVHTEEHNVSTTSSSLVNTSSTRFGSIDPQKRSKNQAQQIEQTTQVGTLLSGDTVVVAAGHNLTATAANIVADHDIALVAGNNLTLNTATDTYRETNSVSQSHTGLMGQGVGVMIGNAKQSQSTAITQTTPTGTTVGSLGGSVTMSAGNNVHLTNAAVLSDTGTVIVGKNVTIDAAMGSTDITQTQKQSSSGVTVSLGGAAVAAAQGIYGAAHRGSEVKDDRLKALYAAQAAYGAGDAYGAAQRGASQSGTSSGINLQVGVGASSASSKAVSHDDTAYGSTIKSNGNVVIAATGGDLNVIGSQISGDNVGLMAANNINLLSQAENHTLTNTNKNASGGVGVQIGTDGIGFYAQASVGKGSAHGNGITHATTSVDATNTLTLISGGDTTIQGAQAKGNTVLADIGGNLNIRSEQDTDDYASKQQQASGKVVVGMGASGSGSYNQSKVDSHYASVTTVSGIGAGDGGYNIHVNGNTDLKGGVIASTADASKNLLDTGSLTYSNIENKASYSATSISVGGGSGASGKVAAVGPSGLSAGIGVPQNDSSHNTTKAGIAQGTIVVRDGNADLSGLDRNATLDQQSLKPIFDLQKVQEQQEMGQVAGYVGMRAVGDLSQYMANHATTDADKASWSDGGANKVILHGMVGAATAALGGGDALGGALGAGASEAASGAMQDYLRNQGIDPYSAEGKSLMQLGSAAIGSVGGGAGAATALAGDSFNRQLHPDEKKLIDTVLAQQYADQHPGMSVELAAQILEGAAGVMLDQTTAANATYDPAAMQEAQNFLHNYALSQGNPTIGYDQFGQPVPLLGVSAPYQRQDPTIFSSNPQTAQGPVALGGSQLADWSVSWLKGAASALNPGNIPAALNSTLQMLIDPQGWMTAQQQNMGFVFYQAQQGNFSPAGQVEGAMAGNAALGAALNYGLLRWGSAGNASDITAGGALPQNGTGGRSAMPNGWIIDAEAGGSSQYDQYRLPSGSWNWPANNGALPNTTASYTLDAGAVIDRIGGTGGTYLSPVGTPLTERALAPGSFAEPYSQYVVLKPFTVEQSSVAPAFGEAGNGVQYKIPEVAPGQKVTVQDLIDNGYLGEKK